VEDLFTSGRIADLILGLMLAEGVVLTVLFRGAAKGLSPALVWTNLLAGAALVLALKSALTGAGWPWTAFGLAGHVSDLFAR
jgi:hypothetical protein